MKLFGTVAVFPDFRVVFFDRHIVDKDTVPEGTTQCSLGNPPRFNLAPADALLRGIGAHDFQQIGQFFRFFFNRERGFKLGQFFLQLGEQGLGQFLTSDFMEAGLDVLMI
jgi:hypothetical protein